MRPAPAVDTPYSADDYGLRFRADARNRALRRQSGGGFQRESQGSVISPDALAAAERQRVKQQVQRVNQVVREQRAHELTAASVATLPPGWAFNARTASTTLSRMMGRVAPDRFLQRSRNDVCLGRVHEVAERTSRRHRLERLRVYHIRAAAEQEGIDAWMTPSNDTNSDTISFRIDPLVSRFVATRGAGRRSAGHDAACTRGTSP
jgi:hypothetical protein